MSDGLPRLSKNEINFPKPVEAPAPSQPTAALWTKEQVEALNRYQAGGWMHPFTCGGKGCRADLVATTRGWICLYCDYTQDWAHDFMFKPAPEGTIASMVAKVKSQAAQPVAPRQFKGFVSFGCGKHPRNAQGGSAYNLDCLDCQRSPQVAWFSGEIPSQPVASPTPDCLCRHAIANFDGIHHDKRCSLHQDDNLEIAAHEALERYKVSAGFKLPWVESDVEEFSVEFAREALAAQSEAREKAEDRKEFMQQAILNRGECLAVAELINKHMPDIPDSEVSDDLRSAAEKIQAVTTSPE